jgi:hypothetical protein
MSYARTMRGLGADCGPCTIASGGDCEICPDGASDDFPECAGCVNGMRQTAISAVEQSLLFPIVTGVLTTLAVVWLSHKMLKKSA